MRVAAIDIGTNTALLLVADGGAGGALRAVVERASITRLGEGVDRSRSLSSAAVARTHLCLEQYARQVRELSPQRVAVVGTSAMRDAQGGQELRECVRLLFGVDVRVLSGEEEARLAFRGAVGGLAIDGRKDCAVFDIGGGSTEVVIGRVEEGVPRIGFAASYNVGSVRLTERHFTHDPPTEAERVTVTQSARGAFMNVPLLPDSSPPVGIAGTMTTLAAVALGLENYDGPRVHGHILPTAELRGVVQRLAAVNLEKRKQVPGMEPKRADVIVAGGLLALAVLDHWTAGAVRISDRGVRWGLAEELLLSP